MCSHIQGDVIGGRHCAAVRGSVAVSVAGAWASIDALEYDETPTLKINLCSNTLFMKCMNYIKCLKKETLSLSLFWNLT